MQEKRSAYESKLNNAPSSKKPREESAAQLQLRLNFTLTDQAGAHGENIRYAAGSQRIFTIEFPTLQLKIT
ncbi:MAG: hypothetical protein ACLTMK_05720 [Christensenellaceae bacterium]